MLRYVKEVKTIEHKIYVSNDNLLYNHISQDYKRYYELSENEKNLYSVVIHAVYSCITKVNTYSNRKEAYKELSNFLRYIESVTGIIMIPKFDINMSLSFTRKDKKKTLIKRYKNAA